MLHVLGLLFNKNHTDPLSLTSLSQLNLLVMGSRPLSNRDAIQPWMGHRPSSTPTLKSERRSRVVGRGIDPESGNYAVDHPPPHNFGCGLLNTCLIITRFSWSVWEPFVGFYGEQETLFVLKIRNVDLLLRSFAWHHLFSLIGQDCKSPKASWSWCWVLKL